MTSKNNRVPLPYYVKLCVSFQNHGWIQAGVNVRKLSIRVNIGKCLPRVTCKFHGWPWKTMGHLYNANRCTSFQSHLWIIIWIAVRKRSIWIKINVFLSRVTLIFDEWPNEKSRAHLSSIKPCASFRSHQWIQAEEWSGNAQFGSKSVIFEQC